jgi:hypothetical protein
MSAVEEAHSHLQAINQLPPLVTGSVAVEQVLLDSGHFWAVDAITELKKGSQKVKVLDERVIEQDIWDFIGFDHSLLDWWRCWDSHDGNAGAIEE